MAQKERRATDKLNVALSGIESCLSMVEEGKPFPKAALALAQKHCEEARAALDAIRRSVESI